MTGAPRLAIITNDYPPKPGGIQQYLGNLVDAYPADVRVLAPADAAAAGTRRGERIVRRSPRRFMWPTPGVAAWCERELAAFAPEAILFGAPHPLPALTARLRRRFDVPTGVLCHGAEVTIPAAIPGPRQLLAAMLRAADVRFAVSRFTANRVAHLTGADAVSLGAGVDVDRFVPAAHDRAGPTVVGCVSRFVPRKGQRRLLAATARVRAAGGDVEVVLVGKGRDERRLRAEASRLEVPTRFAVDVPWGELPAHYGAMDVFCMPCRSRWGGLEVEGLGLVFLEAAAVGLPVLAGDSGGAPETVVPGVTGYVVHDVADIAEALQMLIATPERRCEMGAAGRERVEAEFTWEAVVRRLVAGFSAVMGPATP